MISGSVVRLDGLAAVAFYGHVRTAGKHDRVDALGDADTRQALTGCVVVINGILDP